MGGPFPAKNTDTEQPENEIVLQSIPNAMYYSVYVTPTPEPPVGRHYYGVAEMVETCTVVHRGGAAHVPVGFPPTPATDPPKEIGNYLLAVTSGEPVEDTGQPLQSILPPTVNETRRTPLSTPSENWGSVRNVMGSVLGLRLRGPAYSPTPSFAWTGYTPIYLETTVDSGGVNHYQMPPAGGGNVKNTLSSALLHLTSRTQSQIANFAGYLTSYGMGDTIWMGPTVTVYGGTRDAGDEGMEAVRSQVTRMAEEAPLTLTADAPRGATRLPADSVPGNIGAGRTVVNLSQTHSAGRIEYVANCDAYGLGTNWTEEMIGRWISFDVDTQPKTGVRQWYQIDAVESAERLRFRAITTWSSHNNLGFSRFIRDAKTGVGPGSLHTNELANMTLPPEREPAALEGKYLIAPGTQLDDPYHEGNALNVEPLRETWHSGDHLVVAAGPQTMVQQMFAIGFGDYMPQDVIMGFNIANFGDRTANGPAINPDNPGWATGIRVSLPDSGAGNAINIVGTKTRYSAIVTPRSIPVFRSDQGDLPYLQFAPESRSLDVRDLGGVSASFGVDGLLLRRPTRVERELRLEEGAVFTGSDRIRGQAVFSGDGARKEFAVTFREPFASEPFVQISTNQFARSRIARVSQKECVIEFEEAPAAGTDNVRIWWFAIQ